MLDCGGVGIRSRRSMESRHIPSPAHWNCGFVGGEKHQDLLVRSWHAENVLSDTSPPISHGHNLQGQDALQHWRRFPSRYVGLH
jgi:hypothetical protein